MHAHEAASGYAVRGWRVLALHAAPEGVCSCAKGLACRSAGKHPVATSWQDGGPLTTADLATHFGDGAANVGIATGATSGFWVLDVDPEHDGDESLAALVAVHGPLPATYTVRTGSGGTHYYFALDGTGEVAPSTVGRLGPGLDTRGEGGQVVAPPSVSAKGSYALVSDAELTEAPSWLLDLLRPVDVPSHVHVAPPTDPGRWMAALLDGTAADLKALYDQAEGWDLGTFKVAVRLAEIAKSGWNTLTAEQARAHLHVHAPLQDAPCVDYPVPWTSEDVEAKWRSGWRKAAPVDPPADRDAGLAFDGPATVGDDEGSSWLPQDLTKVLEGTYERLLPEVGILTDGRALFYRGKTNAVFGESESGKSWAVMVAAAQALKRGETVVYIDFEDDQVEVVGRMKMLGADTAAIKARFHYIAPDAVLTPADRDALFDLVDATDPSLIVLDGVTNAMTLHGLSILDNTDVSKFDQMLPRALAKRRNAAVVTVDHVTKSNNGGTPMAIGGQHKRAAATGVAYLVRKVKEFAPTKQGYAQLIISKDRPGSVRQHAAVKVAGGWIAAEFHMDATDPDHLDAEFRTPEVKPSTKAEPASIMELISGSLEAAGGELPSRAEVLRRVKDANGPTRDEVIDAAIGALESGRYLSVPGGRQAGKPARHVLVKPFFGSCDVSVGRSGGLW